MKTKLLLLSVITSITPFLSAQEYEYVPLVREGVEWGYYTYKAMTGNVDYGYYRYKIEEDTLINSVLYKKLNYYESCADENPIREGYLREEDKKVYFLANWDRREWVDPENREEVVLYDFTPEQAGDIMTTNSLGYVDPESPIEKIDFVLIDGKLRKRFHFYYGIFIYIEGIGQLGADVGDLINPFLPTPTGGYYYTYLSYLKRSDGVYEYITDSHDNPCIESAIEEISSAPLHIAPYPGQWVVTLPDGAYRLAEVIDTTGRVAWCDYLDGVAGSITIPTTDLARGVYIIALTAQSGERITCKVVL